MPQCFPHSCRHDGDSHFRHGRLVMSTKDKHHSRMHSTPHAEPHDCPGSKCRKLPQITDSSLDIHVDWRPDIRLSFDESGRSLARWHSDVSQFPLPRQLFTVPNNAPSIYIQPSVGQCVCHVHLWCQSTSAFADCCGPGKPTKILNETLAVCAYFSKLNDTERQKPSESAREKVIHGQVSLHVAFCQILI